MSLAEAKESSRTFTARPIEPVGPDIFSSVSSSDQIDLGFSLFAEIKTKDPNIEGVDVLLINKNMVKSEPVLFRKSHTPSVWVTPEEEVLGQVRYKSEDSPTTTSDIIFLLGDPTNREVATPFVLIVTPKEHELYMRTDKTPSLNKDKLTKVRKKWESKEQGAGLINLLRGKKNIADFAKQNDILKFSGPRDSRILKKVIL